MDSKDRQILDLLQQDATLQVAQIAEQVGLSRTPCWRRIRELEKNGYIQKRVALLDRTKLDLPITVFVAVKTNQHNAKWLETFRKAVNSLPEIVEAYRLSGDSDYLLRVIVKDIAGFDTAYQRLIERVDFSDVSSSFSMEELKFTTAIPLN
ncbi:MAG: Lrp/AsnC family transcriptional regulator [Gammaproteobacteria bacterium]